MNADDLSAENEKGKWVRLPRQGELLCGLTRSFLYQLCASGAIQSVSVQGAPPANGKGNRRKTSRGVRLVYLPSLQAYLEALRQQQHGK